MKKNKIKFAGIPLVLYCVLISPIAIPVGYLLFGLGYGWSFSYTFKDYWKFAGSLVK